MKRLDGKTCIVTGGAHGIGKATCLRLGEEGASVAITDIADQDGRRLRAAIFARGGTAEHWHLDVTDAGAVDEVFGAIADRVGGAAASSSCPRSAASSARPTSRPTMPRRAPCARRARPTSCAMPGRASA